MRIYVDVKGTVIGNADHSIDVCLQLVQDMDEAGHDITFTSGDAAEASRLLDGADVVDKADLMSDSEAATGRVLIDDDASILAAWVRRGGIAVPAASLMEFANVVRG